MGNSMWPQPLRTCVLCLATIMCLGITPQGATESGIDQRVDALENKMDAILGLLQKLTPPEGAASRKPRVAAPPPASMDIPVLCEDAHSSEECQTWAAGGECTANKDFMHTSCQRSCNVCTDTKEASVPVQP